VVLFRKRSFILNISPSRLGYWNQSEPKSLFCHPQVLEFMVARDGIEPPTPAFSGLRAFIRGATPLANASRWTALVSLTPHLLADFEAVWSEATGIRVKFELNRVACYNS
jgi:hypothetical protein